MPRRLRSVSTLSSERWVRGSPVTSSTPGFFGGLRDALKKVSFEKRFKDLPKLLVVCATTRCMDETSSDTRYKELVVNEKLYN